MHGKVAMSTDKVCYQPPFYLHCVQWLLGQVCIPSNFQSSSHTQQLYCATAALRIVQQLQQYALCHSSNLQHCQPVMTAYRVVLAIDADCVLVLHCCSALYVMHASLHTAVKAQ